MTRPSQDDLQIQALENICRTVQSLYSDSHDKEGADMLTEVIETVCWDIRKRAAGREGSLDDLSRLKVAVRISGLLMQNVQNEQPSSMVGWIYRRPPKNTVQRVYGFITDLSIELMKSVLEIEAEFPAFQEWFDLEREEYRSLCDSQMVAAITQ